MATLTRSGLPEEVEELAPRMREIATIVYLGGAVTLKEVQQTIDDELTIYGIRTLLNRLIQRGIVKSRRSGRHSEIIYLPAIVTPEICERALAHLVNEQFEGSVRHALVTAMRMARDRAELRSSHRS